MPIVRVLPILQSEAALLELRNDFDRSVMVKQLLLGSGATKRLLFGTVQLETREARPLDITGTLRSMFTKSSEPQERLVVNLLILGPEPPNQAGPSNYRVRCENGRITKFSSE